MTERAEHTAFTPRPWVVGDSGRMVMRDIPGMCDGHDGYAVAVTSAHSLLPVEEARANARLIAAAPDLLAALKVALPRLAHRVSCHSTRPISEWEKHGSSSFDQCDCEIKVVRAAVARATGEA